MLSISSFLVHSVLKAANNQASMGFIYIYYMQYINVSRFS